MKNKFLLSVAASALLTTTAFAAIGSGQLNLSAGGGASTTEYNLKYGNTQALDLKNLEYRADILGSGSVSDPLIRLDLTDTNLSATSDAGLVGLVIQNSETNDTIATYDRKILANGRTYFLFDGDATKSIVDGQLYHITNDQNASQSITYSLNANTDKVKLDVWSTSGTEEQRDATEAGFLTTVTPQFSTACVAKFDGLINFEDFRRTFVSTNHSLDANKSTDHSVSEDTLVFTVQNNRGTGNFLEGNASVLTFFTTNKDGTVNVDNNFSDNAKFHVDLLTVNPDGTSVSNLDIGNIPSVMASPTAVDANGSFDYNLTNGRFDLALPLNADIQDGLTTYYVSLVNQGNNPIFPVKFSNPAMYMEAGMVDDNHTITPQANTGSQPTDLGEWKDYTYIAQIPGATQDAFTQTKLFITNRSCKNVTPTFRLIKDGVVTEVEGDEIAINTQAKVTLATLLTKAGLAEGRYAVEIIIPGVAEDFYVYAQAQGKANKAITKDLPVYNTSNRG